MASTSNILADDRQDSVHDGPHDWEQHKETIHDLYIAKNLTLQCLIHEMKKSHAFNATKAQYERRLTRWGFKKNRKKREWIEIAEKVVERQNEGKDSEVVVDDQIIPAKKLKKEIQRYGRELKNPISTQATGIRHFNIAASSSVAIVRSPKAQFCLPRTRMSTSPSMFSANIGQSPRVSLSSVPYIHLLQSNAENSPSPMLVEASSFLRDQHSMQKASLRASLNQLLVTSSPLNKSLKAAMIPSEYSKLMSSNCLNQDRLSTATNLKIMTTAIFLFRNSLAEGSFDLGHQMFTWFQANYDARMFKFLASKRAPSAFAILEKLFRQAVWEGDSDMVHQLLLIGIEPNQRWKVLCSVRHLHTEPKSAIQIACERKYLRVAKLLLDAGSLITAETDPAQAPLCCLLEGNSALDLDLVKNLMDATPSTTLWSYAGCLVSAVRRKDLKLIELLIGAGVGDNDIYRLSCLRQGCPRSKGDDLLPCPTHTISFPVLKKLFLARVFHFLASKGPDPSWVLYGLLDSCLNQRNLPAVNFLLDAGVCFTTDLLLCLCGIPDLVIVGQLLPQAIMSFEARHEEDEMSRIVSKLPDAVSLEPVQITQRSKSSAKATDQSGDLTENVAMARKIAETLTELPDGIKLQCCKTLAKNPLWRSLAPQDWPFYKEAFEIILHASNSNLEYSRASILIAVRNHDAVGLHRLVDANTNYSAEAIRELLDEVIIWGDVEIFIRLMNELTWVESMNEMNSWNVDAHGSHFMSNAILRGNLAGVQELCRAGIAVDFALLDGDGLVLAIRARQLEIVEFLLRSGADPNRECESGSPLPEALASRHGDILKLLLRYGANPNNAETLCLARELNLAVLDTFLRACKKDFLVKGGVPALINAIAHSELDTVQLLLGYGMDCNLLVEVKGGRRWTCVAAAIEAFDDAILQLVLDAGGNVNSIVELGLKGSRALPQACAALAKAIECENLGAIDILLEAGAEVNPTEASGPSVGLTPLRAAVEQGDLDLVQKLLDLGGHANEKPITYGGYTALQIAASKGLIGIASLLLEHGADINAEGARRGGRTALEAAAENDRIDMVRFLVDSGARIIGPDAHQYKRAKALALENGHFAVCKLLEAFHEKQSSGQSPQALSSAEDDFGFSSEIPMSCVLLNESLGFTPIHDLSDLNDNQSGSTSSIESWAWPVSSLAGVSLHGISDERSLQSTSLPGYPSSVVNDDAELQSEVSFFF